MPFHVNGPSGSPVRALHLAAPPAAPYTLLAQVTIAEDAVDPKPIMGVRSSVGDASAWFHTEQELTAQTAAGNRYEIRSRITSGVAVAFSVDAITDPMDKLESRGATSDGAPLPAGPVSVINSDAMRLLQTEGAVVLRLQTKDESFAVSLTGNFNEENKMWSVPGQHSGWHRDGKIIRTLYKHIPITRGGANGYLHIVGTVTGDTPEVQFDLNWHNGGIEERRTGANTTKPIDLNSESNAGSPPDPYGQYRGSGDILFSRIAMELSPTIPPADGFAGLWTWTPQLPDSVHNVAFNAFVKVISNTDANRQHILPITFERPFRFAVHPTSVTPYLKIVYGFQDRSLVVQDAQLLRGSYPTAAEVAAIDLSNDNTDCKAALTALTPWTAEPAANAFGMLPVNALYPGAYSPDGGNTGGAGMWPWYGAKWFVTGQRAGYEILLTEQLRVRSRTYGALYYNISGMPVNPYNHAPGGFAPWRRFNRRFEKSGSVVKDAPFYVSLPARKMHKADYNPGPRTGSTPVDSTGDPTPSVPDWWVAPVAGNAITPLPFQFTLAHTGPPNVTDLAVPVIVQVQGAGAFDENKSITVRVTGTGELDIAATETFVLTGSLAVSPPPVQAAQSLGSFKTVSKVEITASTGVLLSTELISIGRASVGVADYTGGDGITAIDDQHFIRMHSINKALFLGANDCLSKIYLLMDAASELMTQWPGTGAAQRLKPVSSLGLGHGAVITRELAWCGDVIATTYAIGCAHWGKAATEDLYGPWVTTFVSLITNSQMSNGLVQAYAAKEGKQTPYGNANGGEGTGVFWMASGREAAYFVHACAMLCRLYQRPIQNAMLEEAMGKMALGFRDFLWHVADGIKTGVHAYLPVALHRNAAGVILQPGTIDPNGTWEVYATQTALPAANPTSGVLINPGTYPPVDDDLYVGAILGNAAAFGAGDPAGAMSAMTLLRNDTNSGGAGLLPTPVEVKITVAGTFTNAKRRWIRVTGTSPLDTALVEDIPLVGNSAATQTFRGAKHFKTVTQAIMLTQAQATALGTPNQGTLVVGESFVIGTPKVGLKYDNQNAPTLSDNYQVGYALDNLTNIEIEDPDPVAAAITCALRFCGTAGVPAADENAAAVILDTWTEYAGGPARMEQWMALKGNSLFLG